MAENLVGASGAKHTLPGIGWVAVEEQRPMAALASAAASLATMAFAPACWACCDLLLRPDGNAPRKCFLASVARPVGRAQQLGAQQEVTSENMGVKVNRSARIKLPLRDCRGELTGYNRSTARAQQQHKQTTLGLKKVAAAAA